MVGPTESLRWIETGGNLSFVQWKKGFPITGRFICIGGIVLYDSEQGLAGFSQEQLVCCGLVLVCKSP